MEAAAEAASVAQARPDSLQLLNRFRQLEKTAYIQTSCEGMMTDVVVWSESVAYSIRHSADNRVCRA